MLSTAPPSQAHNQVEGQGVKTRQYTKAPGTAYVLPSDEEERQRLTKQHAFLKRAFGGLVYAPIKLTSQDFVLDSATGTGIWLLELANQSPKGAQFIGIDIESRLFPHASTLPPRVDFQVQSVLNLPDEWTNKFTFVHQRLLIAALRTTEWPQAFREIYRVLKPGGWLQMLEGDDWVAGPVMKIFQSIMTELGKSRGIDLWLNVGPALKSYLEDCGFVDVRVVRESTPTGQWAGQDGIDGREDMLALQRGIKIPVLEGGGFGFVSSEAMYDDLLDRVAREMDSTPGAAFWWVRICARKPEAEPGQ